MAKKTADWDKISGDRELLARAEALVKECAGIKGTLPKELCDELNALTGNGWKAERYKEFCDDYDWKRTLEETVYALFHGGEYPAKKEDELHAWKIEESVESDREVIVFFHLCAYQEDHEKCRKYEQVDVRPLNQELLAAFAGWEIEDDWEANDFITFCCSNRKNYGLEKVLKIYNGYDQRFLHCRLFNFDEQEKETVIKLLQKYYNHITTDLNIENSVQPTTDTCFDEDDMAAIMKLLCAYDADAGDAPQEITREYLEENREVSSYNEGTEEQIDYYIDGQNVRKGDKAYMYLHEGGELRELEILYSVVRSEDPAEYDRLLEEEDVLIRLEDEYGADTSAEFITDSDCYLICFKEVGRG